MLRDNKGRFIKGFTPWNKGLDKTDKRVLSYVKANIKEKIKRSCILCKKDYLVIPSRKDKTLFCSRRCVSSYLGEKFTKKNSYWRNDWNKYVYLLGKQKRGI